MCSEISQDNLMDIKTREPHRHIAYRYTPVSDGFRKCDQ
jgi:hypothetical protein